MLRYAPDDEKALDDYRVKEKQKEAAQAAGKEAATITVEKLEEAVKRGKRRN